MPSRSPDLSSVSGQSYPAPPGLHWGWLIASLVGAGVLRMFLPYFQRSVVLHSAAYALLVGIGLGLLLLALSSLLSLWLLVEAAFVRRLCTGNRAVVYVAAGLACRWATAFLPPHTTALNVLLLVLFVALCIAGLLSMRQALEAHYNGPEPYGLELNRVLLLLFSAIYLQYHFHAIALAKRAAASAGS